ncbi:hypothetical protein QWY28_11855 [Nocardioides sp. SOB77]|uniref:Uncharacterized protein n=1 Tax=Nocardioides oceani TaxID=3058369 RepID=A0ABT8FG31_9ACTN|nr:hypothetical protein [Nocardioides oceani]MDN4173644.1 hypothetical protein [Nocardioides oceani]
MRTPTPRTGKIVAAAATPLAVLAAAGLVWQSSYAAFTGTTRNSGNEWSTGAVALTDDDNGSARFQVAGMVPMQTDTKCIKATANASVPGTVRGYAVNPVVSAQGLENHVKVEVASGDGGGFGSCDGFVPVDTVIPAGTSLKQLATFDEYADAVGGWDVPAGTSSRTYRITWTFDTSALSQAEVDQLQGAKTGIDFQWELQSS